jgi:hypothetical protein
LRERLAGSLLRHLLAACSFLRLLKLEHALRLFLLREFHLLALRLLLLQRTHVLDVVGQPAESCHDRS